MKSTIRTFIAISLNQEIQQALSTVQKRLKKLDCPIKWVNPGNIHLTLKFLGDVLVEDIDKIKKELDDISRNIGSIKLELTQLGAFPNIDRPKILWVGLKDDDHKIADLVSVLENNCEKLGFPKESRAFSPHITIGRIRSPKNLKVLSETLAQPLLPTNLAQEATHMTLYKSTLTPQGPIYEILQEFIFDIT